MYASYNFYTTTYGGRMSETAFNSAERKAEAYIRSITYPNGDIFETADDENVMMAVCSVAEAYYSFYGVDGKGMINSSDRRIKSESNDGYSVTYADEGSAESEKILNAKLYSAARTYLLPTGWLKRGIKYYDYR